MKSYLNWKQLRWDFVVKKVSYTINCLINGGWNDKI